VWYRNVASPSRRCVPEASSLWIIRLEAGDTHRLEAGATLGSFRLGADATLVSSGWNPVPRSCSAQTMSMERVEAVLLTGGASRRMGENKAELLIDGEPLAVRIARLLGQKGVSVTVCGREPLAGHAFLRDAETFGGPLAALSAFVPSADLVFVASCDLPGFNPAVVDELLKQIGDHEAAVPILDGRPQPLCALYRAKTFEVAKRLSSGGERRVAQWLEELDRTEVEGIDSDWLANVNTPEDLGRFLGR
jgi:molybdopterin-guanine dinucleotide biosynthesis protein A